MRDFKGICEEKEKIIESLKDNPFYFNLKIIPMKSDFDKKPSNGRVYNKETIMKQVKDMIKKFDDGELMMFDLEHPELYE